MSNQTKHIKWSKKKIGFAILLITLLIYFLFCLPKPLFQNAYCKVLEDENGHLLCASISGDGQWRFSPLDSIPLKFAQSLILFEDKRFYSHLGVDPISLGRAIKQNLSERRVVSGASTLSMQVIRLSTKKKRTIKNKLLEIIKALRLETRFSKDEILKLYASHAPFGGNVVGLEAASWRYYGKEPEMLSWAEAATLAVLPNAPSLIHPGRNREALKNKRDRLLKRLYKHGKIDSLTYSLSLDEGLPEAPKALPKHAKHLLHTAYQFEDKSGKRGKIKTSIDLFLQQDIEELMNIAQSSLDAEHIYNSAAIVIHVPTGKVKAYIGNAPFAKKENQGDVDIIQAPRSTGSIFKPFLFALSLDEGQQLPSSILKDIPLQINGYTPENFNKDYVGMIPIDKALSKSLNIPFVNLLQEYKVEKFYNFLQEANYAQVSKGADHYGLSLILGGAEASLWELCTTYAGMARTLNSFNSNNSTYSAQDFSELTWVNNHKNTMHKREAYPSLLSAGAIWHTFTAMQEVTRPDQEGNWQAFDSSDQIAWKTGTSFGFRDAWAIGVSPEYVVGVWTGNADGEGRPNLIGVKKAAPIMFDIFKLLPDSPWFEKPYDDLKEITVCRQSGYRNQNGVCPKVDTIWAPKVGLKSGICNFHQVMFTNQEENALVNASCYPFEKMKRKVYFRLPPTEAHYYKSHDPNYVPVPPMSKSCTESLTGGNPMEFIYPKNENKIYIPIEIDGSKGKTIFKVAHLNEKETLYWHLDDTFVDSTKRFHELALNPTIGEHKITIVDSNSNSISKKFEILER